jgi:hypothetical protein
MMMALVVVTVSVAVLMAGVPSATAESEWILGDEGEACNSVCARNSKSCNADQQSLVTSEELFKEKLSMAGYESGEVLNEAGDKRCQDVTFRRYAGAPFVANGGKTCVFLTPGRKSVCKRPWVRSHRPLCYCEDTTPDPCAGFQCGDNAVCVSPDGTPKCVCLPGLIGDPDVICDYDDCEHEPCSNGGTCVDDIGSYSCLCPDGYVGNDCEIKNTTPVPTTATGNTTPVPTTATESVDCIWGDWEIGRCSQTCGEGTRVDVRYPKRQAANGGQECEGPYNRIEKCETLKPCPVHCQWGDWREMDECSKTCGVGTKVMKRTPKVKAGYDGKECDGADTKRELCSFDLCPASTDPAPKKTDAEMFLEECLTNCGQDLKSKTRCKEPGETECLDLYTEMMEKEITSDEDDGE